MVTSRLLTPSVVKTLKVSDLGLTEPTGKTLFTFSLTLTACELPIGMPFPSLASTVIVPLYEPAARLADVTLIVKVALPPKGVAAGGLTANQPAPVAIAADAIIVTPLSHVPVTLILKLCGSGLAAI